ncbi:hypothetical protein [Fibrisoma montanum]|uniref:hypothetical protein n=1 Tax=Fibrisoma montanum TaxID=2305895 RepID=UPI001313FB4F|nr:hypothetical protein [Fibrisoma montanum]
MNTQINSLHEQVALLQKQIDSLTRQVSTLTSRVQPEPAQEVKKKEIGINRYRQLHGKA